MIKKLSCWLCRFVDTDHKDEVKGCLDIIFRHHTTEQSVAIFIEVRSQYEEELRRRMEQNRLENEQIENYFVSVKE
jgi:hypothetical protein